ncbi:hypothetical protein B0H14DRAFT_3722180 [Mycena olivaceomarginata]|nr:hypothetical protein B0H14DRAFT_3722180 [Mycena olivaceomarginata]
MPSPTNLDTLWKLRAPSLPHLHLGPPVLRVPSLQLYLPPLPRPVLSRLCLATAPSPRIRVRFEPPLHATCLLRVTTRRHLHIHIGLTMRLIPAGASSTPPRAPPTPAVPSSPATSRATVAPFAADTALAAPHRRPSPVVFGHRPRIRRVATTTAQHISTWLVRPPPLRSRSDAHLYPSPLLRAVSTHLVSPPSPSTILEPHPAHVSCLHLARGSPCLRRYLPRCPIAYTTVPSPVSRSLSQPTYLFSPPSRNSP